MNTIKRCVHEVTRISSYKKWLLLVVIVVSMLLIAVLRWDGFSNGGSRFTTSPQRLIASPRNSWRYSEVDTDSLLDTPLTTTAPKNDSYSADSEGVMSQWYKGSSCSNLRDVFVGDQPLYPSCRRDIASDVIPTWGKFPYLEVPYKYLKGSKNPCWKEGEVIKCLPYFYLIGISKSGSSDLYTRLRLHPDVITTKKEIHYFDKRRFFALKLNRPRKPRRKTSGPSYTPMPSFEDYIDYFSELAEQVEEDLYQKGKSIKVGCDATPSYFFNSIEWKKYSGNEGCTEPRVILANHIRHLYPDAKLLLMMRNPISRMYARYLYAWQHEDITADHFPSAEHFHSMATKAIQTFRNCFELWSLRHCVYNKSVTASLSKLRTQESMYFIFLEDWLRIFPREQLMVIRFEDYIKNTPEELMKIYRFLGLDIPEGKQLQKILDHKIMNPGKLKQQVGPMLLETEKFLWDFFHPFNKRLAAMIGEQFLWKEFDPHLKDEKKSKDDSVGT